MFKDLNIAFWQKWLKKGPKHHNFEILGFDLDEPIFDVWTPIKQFFAEEYNVRTKDEDWIIFSLEESPYLINKIPDIPEVIRRIRSTEFLQQVLPQAGAVIGLNLLKYYGKKIHLITARGEKKFRDMTEEQLKKNLIPYDSVNFCPNEEKPLVAAELGVQFFIDDHPEVIEAFLRFKKPPAVIAVLDRPWNRKIKHRKVKRFYGWFTTANGQGIIEFLTGKNFCH